MKVSELIAQLSAVDPDLDVVGDGCDCSNPVKGVSVVPAHEYTTFTTPTYCLIEVDLR